MPQRPPRGGFARRPLGGTSIWLVVVGGALVVALVAGAAIVLLRENSTVDRVVAAGRATSESGTARLAITTVVDGGVGQAKQRIDAGGVVNFTDGSSQLDVRVGQPQADIASSAGGVQLLVVEHEEQTYSRFASWPPQRAWIRSTAGDDAPGLDQALLVDQLDILRPGVVGVRDLGEEVVRGVETTQLSLEVDLARAAAAAEGTSQGDSLQAMAETVADGTVTLDVWAGETIHRLRYEVGVDGAQSDPVGTASAVAAGATVLTVVEYYDLGLPVSVEVPTSVVDEALQGNSEPQPEQTADEAPPTDEALPADEAPPTQEAQPAP